VIASVYLLICGLDPAAKPADFSRESTCSLPIVYAYRHHLPFFSFLSFLSFSLPGCSERSTHRLQRRYRFFW